MIRLLIAEPVKLTMPRISSDLFKEILKNDGFEYVVKSRSSIPIDIDLPNIPSWHADEFEERREWLPDTTVICFESKGSKYKMLRNMGDADCNDGNFGAVYDENNKQIINLISSGDMETTIESLKTDDKKLDDNFIEKLSSYLTCFETVLQNQTELEYLIFKILVENQCTYDLSVIEDWCDAHDAYDDEEDDEKVDNNDSEKK